MHKKIENLTKEIKASGDLKKGPVYAAFDFDNTIIRNDIQEALFGYMCGKGLLRNSALSKKFSLLKNPREFHEDVFRTYHDLAKKKRFKEAYKYAVRILAGFKEWEIKELTRLTILEEGEALRNRTLFGVKVKRGIKLRKNIVELMNSLRSSGLKVWVITASSETVVREAMEALGVRNDGCLGMRLVEVNGMYDDRFIEPLSVLGGKVKCIKKYIHPSKRPMVSAGDSMNDFEMLKYAKRAIVINRSNKLAEEAEKRGWYIIR